jgi:protein ImuB
VDRMACVELPALPLQLLLRGHPEWQGAPVAVVDQDRPQGRILWLNEEAWQQGIRPGLRYAAALSLARQLRAAEVADSRVSAAVRFFTRRLRLFTPEVEPAPQEPGVFWLNATGLGGLYASCSEWARAIHADFQQRAFGVRVVVGYTRFGTRAVARIGTGITVFRSREEERSTLLRVPLDRLPLPPDIRDRLLKLGIRTVGAFSRLPAEGIEKRFGAETARMHGQARGQDEPFQPLPPEKPVRRRIDLDHVERNAHRLAARIAQELPDLLGELAGRGRALGELALGLGLDPGPSFEGSPTGTTWHREWIRPAAPTLDAGQLLELIRLRLESIPLGRGVCEVVLQARLDRSPREQHTLFPDEARRPRHAAGRALARLRAAFGETAVVRARLREAHLPEAQFTWEPLLDLRPARPQAVWSGALVRRIHHRPQLLPGSFVAGSGAGDPDRARPQPGRDQPGRDLAAIPWDGPYAVSGGWWVREVHRDYYFVHAAGGEVLWVFWDRVRGQWYLQGRLE